jgi:hypothetical protein
MTKATSDAQPPALDPSVLAYIEGRLSNSQAAVEKRLIEEREFVQKILTLVAKVCGGVVAVIFALLVFLGWKDWQSINKEITTEIDSQIKSRADTFKDIFENNLGGLLDRALIDSYTSVERERPGWSSSIPAVHAKRLSSIMASENPNPEYLSSLNQLLGNGLDDDANQISDTLIKIVGGKDSYSWIARNPTRLASNIDLLRKRGLFNNKSIVRAYLENSDMYSNDNVRSSALLFAAASGDSDVMPVIKRRLETKPDDFRKPVVIVSLMVLDPDNVKVKELIDSISHASAANDEKGNQDVSLLIQAESLLSDLYYERQSFGGVGDAYFKLSETLLRALIRSNWGVSVDSAGALFASSPNGQRLSARGVLAPVAVKKIAKDLGNDLRPLLDLVSRSEHSRFYTAYLYLEVDLSQDGSMNVRSGDKVDNLKNQHVTVIPEGHGAALELTAQWRRENGQWATGRLLSFENGDKVNFSFSKQ